jgi:hypothetical protein
MSQMHACPLDRCCNIAIALIDPLAVILNERYGMVTTIVGFLLPRKYSDLARKPVPKTVHVGRFSCIVARAVRLG